MLQFISRYNKIMYNKPILKDWCVTFREINWQNKSIKCITMFYCFI